MPISDEHHQAASCPSRQPNSANKSVQPSQAHPGEPSSGSRSNHNFAPVQATGTKAASGNVSSKDSKGAKRKLKGQIQEEVPKITSEKLEDDDCLLAKSMQLHNSHVSPIEDYQVNQTSLPMHSSQIPSKNSQLMECNLSSEMITIKKGVLWQQQDHDKFHQRLLSRWKKRFFILTTDYLVCFKRSTSKVGRSEMGKFLYKTSLGDILAVEWLRPKKSDKGAIILRTKNQFKLFLWTKDNLDDWMTQITAMRLKRKLRNGLADGLNHGKLRRVDNQNGIYENAALPALCDDRLAANPLAHTESSNGLKLEGYQSGGPERTNAQPSELHNVLNERKAQVVSSASHSDQNSIERTALKDTGGNKTRGDGPIANGGEGQPAGVEVGPAAPPRPVINDDRFLASERRPLGRKAKNDSAGDEFVSDERSSGRPKLGLDQSAESGPASKMQRSSSIRRDESHGHDREALESCSVLRNCRDSNDNLVSMSSERSGEVSRKRVQDNGERKSSYELREKQEDLDLDHSQDGEYLARSTKSSTNWNSHPEGAQMQSSIEIVEPPRRLRAAPNFIRRDESWHSMLSLNQFEANQDALRAHPANHGIQGTNMERSQRHSSITRHIESTVTPLRERPFVRQQSMQINRNRRLPSIDQMQATSFDVNQIQNSTPRHGDSQATSTSYHLQQKLLQLQLLHNSNADYAQNRNEQQIYGPGSIATTNHYSYYSMRSNLRSAASEFSFIRPGSSNLNPSLPQAAIAQPSNVINNFSNIPSDRPQFGPEIRPQPMMTPDWKVPLQTQTAPDPMNHNGFGDLIAPSRELPLKPNKKRLPAAKDTKQGSSSTIGSGIVQFFRRTFSRRHKQRPRLAESCSSSLGLPFDDKFESMQRARSAFSTTEGNRGSNRGELIDQQQQQQAAVNQQYRMIDLIEAFANKTTIDRGAYDNLTRRNHMGHHSAQISSPFRASMQNDISAPSQLVNYQQKPRNYLQQQVTGSPLHKSNSISTSTGLSGLNEMMRMNEHRMLVRESLSPSLAPMSGPRSSPLITRSTKVMSVNLTPVTSRREVGIKDMAGYYDRQPPRPSSIYGQPSMISSPISNNGFDLHQDDFVSHRASFHQRPEHMSPLNANLDVRRLHHQMKAPTLDTTREVAEEVSTPTNEQFKPFPRDCLNETNANEMAAPMARNSVQQQRQRPSRIVNPILQSPTMNFIYDNQPAPRARNGHGSSHYDNPRTLENQQSMSSMNLNGNTLERQQSLRLPAGEHVLQQRQSLYYCADVVSPRGQNYNLRQQQRADGARDQANPQITPSRSNVRLSHQSISLDASYEISAGLMGTYTKPSKMVHPSTPTNNQRAHEVNMDLGPNNSSHTHMDNRQLASPSNSGPRSGLRLAEPMVWPSPIRTTQHQHAQQHQRSPLVNRHTRVLKRNDGVQATFIEPEVGDTATQMDSRAKTSVGSMEDKTPHGSQARYGSSTIASDSSTSSSLRSAENQSNLNANKPPASLRASGSEASTNVGLNFDGHVMSNVNEQLAAQVPVRDDETSSRSASSGTDPISTSSSARSSSSVKRKNLMTSGGNNSRSAKSKRDGSVIVAKQPGRLSDGSRRTPSNEHSDENTSQVDVFNDHPGEDRKWVTSKLMQ